MLPISNNWIWVCKLDLSRPDGCRFGFGGGSRHLVFFRRCPLFASNLEQLDLGLQAGLVQTRRVPVWVWGWLEAFRFFRWRLDWMLPILKNWIWVCKLDLSRPDECQFGFGGGSRPFVSVDGALTGCSQS